MSPLSTCLVPPQRWRHLIAVSVLVLPSAAIAQNATTSVVLDPGFRTPSPPFNLFPQDSVHVTVATTLMLMIALAFMVVAAIDCKRFNTSVPLALVAAAAFCVIPESIDNYLAACYWSHSRSGAGLMFTLMGRDYDYYVAIMWWAFGAILGYVLYAVLLREVRTTTLWVCLAISGAADIALEEVLLGYGGIYTYFGHQPLVLISRFPWWWLFSNVASLFLGVALAYRFRGWFDGWRSLFVLGLLPFCYIGGFTLTAMPAIFVIQGDFSPLVTELAGILTAAASVVLVSTTMYLILNRDPFGRTNGTLLPAATLSDPGYAGSA